MLEKNKRRTHRLSDLEDSVVREIIGVTPESPPAEADSLNRQSA